MAATKTKTPAKSSVKLPAKGTEKPQRFRVLLETQGGSEVTGFSVPFDVPKVFGTRARVPVRGTINGTPFRSSIVPMGGRHIMVVNKKLREASGVRGGETVAVTMERDTESRVVTPPEDFARALGENRDAQATWEKLSYTHRREYAEHVADAKSPETRQRRVEKSIAMLAAGKKEPR